MINKPKFLLAGAVLVAVLAVVGYQLYARRAASPEPPAEGPAQAQTDLRQLMKSKLHEEYTYMSFTIWHDKPLTPEKMDGIAAASARIIEVAQGLNAYEPGYRQQGWSTEDVQFFDDKRLQLARVAEELGRAAKRRDGTEVLNFFMHLDNTCQNCHKRFRPDLAWN